MNSIQVFVFLNLAAVLAAILVILIAWQRRRVPGGMMLLLLMASIAAWGLCSALEVAASATVEKIFWSKLCYIGTLTAPAFLLLFALDYTGRRQWVTRRNLLLLFSIPTVLFLLALTNEQHGLIWSSFTPNPDNPRILLYGHGPVFWLGIVAYGYACTFTGSLQLLRAAFRLPRAYRPQSAALLLACFFPWAGNLAYISGSRLLQGIDLTPVSFSLTGAALAYAMFRFRLLDLVPIARDTLVENLQDGVIVLDNRSRLIDINPAAVRLLGLPPGRLLGRPVTELLNHTPAQLTQPGSAESFEMHTLSSRENEKILDASLAVITSRHGEPLGRLLTLRDITAHKRIENELQQANERLRLQLSEINTLQQSLREQAIRDPLTGLYNRRFLNEVLEIELARAERENNPVSLVMLDLDRFKDFNDSYGHAAGDKALVLLGDLLRTQTRQGDFACRYGGEEFVIVMPGAPLPAALKRSEQWRYEFSTLTLEEGGRKLSCTFSAGVATFPIHAASLDALLRAADEALYAAKSLGRNRVAASRLPQPVR